jgi:hypothetical protein
MGFHTLFAILLMTFKEFRRFWAASMTTGDILGRKDARIRKQVQPFHIFDLPTNLDTSFYEYDQPLIEHTACTDRKRGDNLNLYQAHIKVTIY